MILQGIIFLLISKPFKHYLYCHICLIPNIFMSFKMYSSRLFHHSSKVNFNPDKKKIKSDVDSWSFWWNCVYLTRTPQCWGVLVSRMVYSVHQHFHFSFNSFPKNFYLRGESRTLGKLLPFSKILTNFVYKHVYTDLHTTRWSKMSFGVH